MTSLPVPIYGGLLKFLTTNFVHKLRGYQRYNNEIFKKLRPQFVVVPIVFVLCQWLHFLKIN